MSWNRTEIAEGSTKLSEMESYATEPNGCALAFSADSKSLYMVFDDITGINKIAHWRRTEGALQETPDVTEVLDQGFTYKRAQVKVSPDGLVSLFFFSCFVCRGSVFFNYHINICSDLLFCLLSLCIFFFFLKERVCFNKFLFKQQQQ